MEGRAVRNRLVIIFAMALGFMVSIPLAAHHGAATLYGNQTVTLKGTVKSWFWSNPDCLRWSFSRCLERVVGRPQLQFIEEHLVQLMVVILTCVDEDMPGKTFKRGDHPAQSDNFRPGADNGHDFHRRSFRFLHTVIPKVSGMSGSKISSAQKSTISSS